MLLFYPISCDFLQRNKNSPEIFPGHPFLWVQESVLGACPDGVKVCRPLGNQSWNALSQGEADGCGDCADTQYLQALQDG